MHEGQIEPSQAREGAASEVMDLRTRVSCGPSWVRLPVASIIVPIAILLDRCVLICSRRATCYCCCCCCCILLLVLLLWIVTFHLVGSYMESHGPLLVSHDGVLLAAPTPVSTRTLSAGLGSENFWIVKALLTIAVPALRILARSASLIVSILEWIAVVP